MAVQGRKWGLVSPSVIFMDVERASRASFWRPSSLFITMCIHRNPRLVRYSYIPSYFPSCFPFISSFWHRVQTRRCLRCAATPQRGSDAQIRLSYIFLLRWEIETELLKVCFVVHDSRLNRNGIWIGKMKYHAIFWAAASCETMTIDRDFFLLLDDNSRLVRPLVGWLDQTAPQVKISSFSLPTT